MRVTHARRRWQLEEAFTAEADSADKPRPGHLQQSQTGQGQDEEGLVPLSVAMDACLVQGVLHQYRCVSKACLGYACLLSALHNQLDWSKAVSDRLA